jgi:hypothetical protein
MKNITFSIILFVLFISSFQTIIANNGGGKKPKRNVSNNESRINLLETPKNGGNSTAKINILENANAKVNLLDPRFNANVNTANKDSKFTIKNGMENKIVAMPSLLASLGGATVLSQVGLCGEKFPLDNQNALERLERTFQHYMNCRGALSHYMYMSGRYKAEFVKTLQRQGVPAEFYYLSIAESGLSNLTSSKGAAGFWQFMPESATQYGLEVSETVDERWHPKKAAEAAAMYLKGLYRRFGRWTSAAAAYNMGEGGIEAAMAAQGTKDYYSLNLNEETGQYVYNIVTIKYMMEHPAMFRLGGGKAAPIRTQIEKVDYDIENLAAWAEDCGTDYQTLKVLNPWLISDKLKVKEHKKYEINLPYNLNEKVNADELIPVPFNNNPSITIKELRDNILRSFSEKGNYKTEEDSTKESDVMWSLEN